MPETPMSARSSPRPAENVTPCRTSRAPRSMVTSRTSSVITRAATLSPIRRASRASGSDMTRYSPAQRAPGTSQVPMFAAKIDVCFVNSTTVITDTSELSLSSATNHWSSAPMRDGTPVGRAQAPVSADRSNPACGPHRVVPRHSLQSPAVDFTLVGGVINPEPDQCGQKSRELHDFGETSTDKQLEQERSTGSPRHRRSGDPSGAGGRIHARWR